MVKGRDGWTESFGKSARSRWRRPPPDTEAAIGGKRRQRVQPASGRGAERTEERAITYAEMALLNRRELDSSVGVGVWREGDNAARESRNPRERRMRLTGTDEERERGLLQFRSLAAAVAGGGNRPRPGSFGEGEYRPGRLAGRGLAALLGRKEPSVQRTPLPLPPPATFSVELGDSKGPFEKRQREEQKPRK